MDRYMTNESIESFWIVSSVPFLFTLAHELCIIVGNTWWLGVIAIAYWPSKLSKVAGQVGGWLKCTRMPHSLAVTLFVVDGFDGGDSLRFRNTEGFVSAHRRRGNWIRKDQNVSFFKYRGIFLGKIWRAGLFRANASVFIHFSKYKSRKNWRKVEDAR